MEQIFNKITDEIKKDMQTIWFVADLHSYHAKIIDICNRPVYLNYNGEKDLKNKEYEDLLNHQHNEWLIKDVINKYVSKNDTLYILGDVSMQNRKDTEKFIDRLNGKKFLILGNHDKNIQSSNRFIQISQIKDFTYSKNELNIHIVLCHYPLLSWNRKVHGAFHLHGHTHGRNEYVNDLKRYGFIYDVGIDNKEFGEYSYRPINLYEIMLIMKKRFQIINNI